MVRVRVRVRVKAVQTLQTLPLDPPLCDELLAQPTYEMNPVQTFYSGFHLTVEREWFWFYYALWLVSVFTLVLVLRQASENRSTV